MAQSFTQLPDDAGNLGKKLDTQTTAIAGNHREAVVIGDPSTDAAVGSVVNADPTTQYGAVVRDPNAVKLLANDGATTDAAVTGDNAGTTQAKLRGLSKIFADVWDSVNHWLKVSIANATLAVTQSGTWTVQPGNTANTTAWKTDSSATTQPVSGTFWQATQPVSAASLPLPTGAATDATLAGVVTITDFDTKAGSLTETAPATDTASSGLNGRLQRIAQRLTSLITALGTPFQAGGNIGNTSFGSTNFPATVDTNSGNKSASTVRVVLATDQPSLTNAVPISAAVGSPAFVSVTPSTTGGWSPSSQTALNSTKATVKAAAGVLGGYMFYNPNASVAYIQVFDVASASVTVGTTPPTYVIPIPAGSAANLEVTNGINHATAIVIAATTTPTGSSALGTALTGFFLFK